MRVRWAALEDARAIAEVHVSSWQVGYRGLIPAETLDRMTIAEREPRWREWLSSPTAPSTLVAGHGGRIEGFCSVAMAARGAEEASDLAEIPAFYVAPGAWRGGGGIGADGARARRDGGGRVRAGRGLGARGERSRDRVLRGGRLAARRRSRPVDAAGRGRRAAADPQPADRVGPARRGLD